MANQNPRKAAVCKVDGFNLNFDRPAWTKNEKKSWALLEENLDLLTTHIDDGDQGVDQNIVQAKKWVKVVQPGVTARLKR